jgi:hypothetical protein
MLNRKKYIVDLQGTHYLIKKRWFWFFYWSTKKTTYNGPTSTTTYLGFDNIDEAVEVCNKLNKVFH